MTSESVRITEDAKKVMRAIREHALIPFAQQINMATQRPEEWAALVKEVKLKEATRDE